MHSTVNPSQYCVTSQSEDQRVGQRTSSGTQDRSAHDDGLSARRPNTVAELLADSVVNSFSVGAFLPGNAQSVGQEVHSTEKCGYYLTFRCPMASLSVISLHCTEFHVTWRSSSPIPPRSFHVNNQLVTNLSHTPFFGSLFLSNSSLSFSLNTL